MGRGHEAARLRFGQDDARKALDLWERDRASGIAQDDAMRFEEGEEAPDGVQGRGARVGSKRLSFRGLVELQVARV